MTLLYKMLMFSPWETQTQAGEAGRAGLGNLLLFEQQRAAGGHVSSLRERKEPPQRGPPAT